MSSKIPARRGRPPVDSERVDARIPREVLDALDRFRTEQKADMSRPEAVRTLVKDGLTDAGYLPAGEEGD